MQSYVVTQHLTLTHPLTEKHVGHLVSQTLNHGTAECNVGDEMPAARENDRRNTHGSRKPTVIMGKDQISRISTISSVAFGIFRYTLES